MRKSWKKTLWVVALLITTSGCNKFMSFFGGGASDPKGVADKFWAATKTGEIEKIKPYVTATSFSSELMKGNAQKTEGEYTLGAPQIESDKATIPTTLKDKGFNIELQTICVKENGKWKVDVNQTMATMFGGAMGEMMKGLEKGLGEMGKALGEGLKEAGKTLEESGSAPTGNTGGAFSTGEKVQVEWHGAWYPATVLEVGSNKWKIHYDGYDNSWDEWVEPNRIKY